MLSGLPQKLTSYISKMYSILEWKNTKQKHSHRGVGWKTSYLRSEGKESNTKEQKSEYFLLR